jgi:hypothetical protein
VQSLKQRKCTLQAAKRHEPGGLAGALATPGSLAIKFRAAALLTDTVRKQFKATWSLSETGAAGPNGNPNGDAAGRCCPALAGTTVVPRTIETGQRDRLANMIASEDRTHETVEPGVRWNARTVRGVPGIAHSKLPNARC